MNFANDVRFGLRTLRKSPGFAVTAVLTMALGIGATTAIFSVCDAMLWKPVPLPHLDTLVMILERNPDDPHDFSGVTAGRYRRHRRGRRLRSTASPPGMTAWPTSPARAASRSGSRSTW